jgi:hypothetical protein
LDEILGVAGLFILRLGVPIAIMAVIGYGLRRLDAKWEAEATASREWEAVPSQVEALKIAEQPEQPCWEIKGCDEERRANCPSCKALDVPCWVARLRATGRLPRECHNCDLFALNPAA